MIRPFSFRDIQPSHRQIAQLEGFRLIILEEVKKRVHWMSVFIFTVLLFACTGTNVAEAPTLEELRNGLYDVDLGFREQPFQMKNGIYFEYPLPDILMRMEFRLTDHIAYNPSGKYPNAAFAIYTLNGGGSGTFFILAVITRQNGAIIFLDSTGLGDRVIINSISVREEVISVDMVDHTEMDGLCCPTQQLVRKFRIQGDELMLISGENE